MFAISYSFACLNGIWLSGCQAGEGSLALEPGKKFFPGLQASLYLRALGKP